MDGAQENTKKVIVIGDGYVGKTCLVSKITEGKFINNYHATIGGMRSRAAWRESLQISSV